MVDKKYEYDANGSTVMPAFPPPFAGINIRIVAESASGLAGMIRAIQRCGHGHNFAVEMDTSVRVAGALWTTQTGAFCATGGKLGSEI